MAVAREIQAAGARIRICDDCATGDAAQIIGRIERLARRAFAYRSYEGTEENEHTSGIGSNGNCVGDFGGIFFNQRSPKTDHYCEQKDRKCAAY